MSSDSQLPKIQELDRALAQIAGQIRILVPLQWPASAEDEFLAAFRAGRPELPKVKLTPRPVGGDLEALANVQKQCDRAHPIGNLVYKTARSYESAVRMLAGIGTPAFTEYSAQLYGLPTDRYRTQKVTPLTAADFFLTTTDRLLGGKQLPELVADIPSKEFGERVQKKLDRFFVEDRVEVVLDPDLASKAVGGSTRIRVREGARFSTLDLAQLVNHEAYVHSATILNGKRQKNLLCLGLGSPRTTRTQEGLAVLAELLTMSIDVMRLRRVALRVRAIQDALEGADFIEVFKGFLEAGQSEEESFKSAQRVFRGGDVRGKVVFTKDSVYLKGLLEVHTFVKVAIRDNRPELVRALFAGRMTLGDVVELAPYFESGWLQGPAYVPPWAEDPRRLVAVLAYSAFINEVNMSEVGLQHFPAFEERAATGSVRQS
ncbi:MAG: DUF1704 domain-containing protein [Planctomycetes bacterium]|nr:DUF1704 domain-containing protein [Planctomycetota bacterium]MCB9902974.1 DUF1704 domain-containing protein [Planctomycetota bacterium]